MGLVLAILLTGCAGECDGPYARCEGNVAARCGWRWTSEITGRWERTVEDCGERACVAHAEEDLAYAFCALDPEPDPACPPELRGAQAASRCEADVVVTWAWGWRVAEAACDGTCADATSPGFTCLDEAVCSPLSEPDARCADPAVYTACVDARTIAYCRCGWRAEAHPCSDPGPSCRVLHEPGLAPLAVCR